MSMGDLLTVDSDELWCSWALLLCLLLLLRLGFLLRLGSFLLLCLWLLELVCDGNTHSGSDELWEVGVEMMIREGCDNGSFFLVLDGCNTYGIDNLLGIIPDSLVEVS